MAFEVAGMSCGACASRAERAAGAVVGPQNAQVNFAGETARITVNGAAQAVEVVDAMNLAGYPPIKDEIRFTVSGMHCGSCVGRVETALSAVPGVLSAKANLAQETVTLEMLEGVITTQELMRIGASAGYQITALNTEQDQGKAQARKDLATEHLRLMLMVAAALTLPVFTLEMGSHLFPAFHHWIMRTIGQQTSWSIQFVLTTLVLAWPGRQFVAIGVPALLKGAPDMNALVALGTSAA